MIQIKWEDEARKDKILLDLAKKIPEEEIEQDFNILMQAVKHQCAISVINQELAKEGRDPVPDVILPDYFPKSTAKRKYSQVIPCNRDGLFYSAFDKPLITSSKVVFNSMPNIHVFDSALDEKMFNCLNSLVTTHAILFGNMKICENGNMSKEEIKVQGKTKGKTKKINSFGYLPKIIYDKKCLRKSYPSKTLSHIIPKELNRNFKSLSTSNLYSSNNSLSKLEISFNKIFSLRTLVENVNTADDLHTKLYKNAQQNI